ncbi:hypothetical protein Barb4_00108 [Bacteroidales bacterium Barb4]|nr:hypothetical protein Barb4_00108 [Bacteroidales bacterium Barb4]
MENLQEILKEEYKKIFDIRSNRPSWAVKKTTDKEEIIHPSIPLIGKNFENKRLLLYASAENLTHYNGKKDTYLDKDDHAINRNRNFFDGSKDFFPNVHIAPVSNGALIIVTAYILSLLEDNPNYSTPKELIEDISIGNFGKFSIDAGSKNQDYAKDPSKLKFSFDYVKVDLKTLQPKILIIPQSIYNHGEIQQLIKSIVPECLVIPIYQINNRVINTLIAKKYPKISSDKIGILNEWQKELKIKGKTKDNFYSVYSYIDNLVATKKLSLK